MGANCRDLRGFNSVVFDVVIVPPTPLSAKPNRCTPPCRRVKAKTPKRILRYETCTWPRGPAMSQKHCSKRCRVNLLSYHIRALTFAIVSIENRQDNGQHQPRWAFHLPLRPSSGGGRSNDGHKRCQSHGRVGNWHCDRESANAFSS